MFFFHLSISVLKVGRQLVGSLTVAAFFMSLRLLFNSLIFRNTSAQRFFTSEKRFDLNPARFNSLLCTLIFPFIFLQGCLREEEPVVPHQAGNVQSRSIVMASDYRAQIFYNLEKDSVMGRNLKTDWDIAFDVQEVLTSPNGQNTEGSKIYLNQAKYMFAWKTNKVELEALTDTVGFFKNRRWDASNNTDTMAIGSVKTQGNSIWIDRGLNEFGDPLDFIRFKFVSATKDKYVFKILRQGSTISELFEIQRDTNYNRVYFSFQTNKAVIVEPKKTDWDLAFTQYMYTFKNPYTPYLVVGVLLNPLNTQAVADSSYSFSKLDKTVAQNLKLTNQIDVIGYNWKAFSGNVFTINQTYNYIVNDQKSYFWKLHFIDFYDSKGTKGSPKFEFQKL
jgi:HmuY protein